MNAHVEAILNTINIPPGARAILIVDESPIPAPTPARPFVQPPRDCWFYDLTGLRVLAAEDGAAPVTWVANVLRRIGEFEFEVMVTLDGDVVADRTEVFDVRRPPRGWFGWNAPAPVQRWRQNQATRCVAA